MTKELQKQSKENSPLVPFREIQATGRTLSELKPVMPKDLELYHPFGYGESKTGLSILAGISSAIACGGIAFIGGIPVGMTVGGFWIVASALTASLTSIMSFTAFADGNPDAKIRNFFSKIFFTKKQRQKLAQSYINKAQNDKKNKEYDEAWEAYQILVQQEIEKLKAKGVFEKQEMSANGSYWIINKYGDMTTIDRSRYHEQYIGKQLTNSGLQQEIIAKIVENYHEQPKMIE